MCQSERYKAKITSPFCKIIVGDTAEYIGREALINTIEWDNDIEKWTLSDYQLDNLPAADVAPVRHGRWLFVTAGQQTSAWCCSECGRSVAITCDEELRQSKLEKEYPFCHCGAKMFEEG